MAETIEVLAFFESIGLAVVDNMPSDDKNL